MGLRCVLLLLLCWTAQLTSAQSPATCPADQPIADVCIASRKIVPSINSFTVDLYKQVQGLSTTTSATNIVLLPIHAALGLLMSCNAARGQAQSEIMTGLHLGADVSCADAATTILDLYRVTPHKDPDAEQFDDVTYQVNRAYVDKTVKLKDDFVRRLSERFNQTPGSVDFKNSNKASSDINHWVSEYTNGRIKDLLAAKDVSPDTQLMIVNAHFLQFSWLMPFEKSLTKKGTFNNADGSSSSVDMMTFKNPQTLQYLDNSKGTLRNLPAFQMVKLFSKWLNAEALIFLPNDVSSLSLLEKSLTADIVGQVSSAAKRTLVQVKLPKFTAELKTDLKPALKGLGIQTLFNKGVDLSPMTDTPVTVSSLLHKARLSVNEQGLEAAAGTVLAVKGIQSIPVQMTVDRPFLWMIRLTQTNFITYVGRVVKL